MKVLIVSTLFNRSGGAENAALMQASLLRKYNQKVVTFSFRSNADSQADYSINCDYVNDKNIVCNLSIKHKVNLFINLIHNFKLYNELILAIKKEKPDIIHLHRVRPFSPSVYLAIKKFNIPVVMTLHDHYLTCLNSTRMMDTKSICTLNSCKGSIALKYGCVANSFLYTLVSLLEFCYRRFVVKDISVVSKYLFPSKFLMNWTIRSGIDPTKLCYLPNFTQKKHLTARSKATNTFVGYVGRLSREKGVGLLIEAARILPEVDFCLVGDGPQKSELRLTIEHYGLRNVKILGPLYGDSLSKFYANALILIVPSECFENAPLVVLEAFNASRPVIGSNRGGIPELIEDGVTGYLFEPENPFDLAEKIRLAISSPAKLEKMGELARERVQNEFSEDVHAHLLLKIYSELLAVRL